MQGIWKNRDFLPITRYTLPFTVAYTAITAKCVISNDLERPSVTACDLAKYLMTRSIAISATAEPLVYVTVTQLGRIPQYSGGTHYGRPTHTLMLFLPPDCLHWLLDCPSVVCFFVFFFWSTPHEPVSERKPTPKPREQCKRQIY